MRRSERAERVLVLGSQGGVGRAFLALIERSEQGKQLAGEVEALFLADRHPPAAPTRLRRAEQLPPTRISSPIDLANLVQRHRITQVIDLSSIDTVECTRICDELGADFLCTSVEEWPELGSIPTDQAIARLLPPKRPPLGRRSHLVGSGANPGIVNALAFAAMSEFAERVGVEPSPQELELQSVLITEEDSTSVRGGPEPNGVFPMTWSPEHCLEELFEPRAFAARNGRVVDLGHAPTDRWYRARCGHEEIEGMAVPHEETKTLAWKLQDVEIAFIYRIPAAARQALAAHPERRTVAEWKTQRLFPPYATELVGGDRLGVLLTSRRYGELWMGFDTPVSRGLPYGTNATQLQVAAGVVAGWSQLGARTGIHFVEDLDWRQFLGVVSGILGPPIVVHDPEAPAISLAERARELVMA